jgi:hypothetical protein
MAEKSKHEQRRSKSMAALGVVFEQQTAEGITLVALHLYRSNVIETSLL